jgi:hypothetical protein
MGDEIRAQGLILGLPNRTDASHLLDKGVGLLLGECFGDPAADPWEVVAVAVANHASAAPPSKYGPERPILNG